MFPPTQKMCPLQSSFLYPENERDDGVCGDCAGSNRRYKHKTHPSQGIGFRCPRTRMNSRCMGKDIRPEKDTEVPKIQTRRERDAVGRRPRCGLVVDVQTVTY